MTNVMTRNIFLFFCFLYPCFAQAAPDSPMIQGLGGAGRSGIPKESLFNNPAALAHLTISTGFLYYTKPKISDFKAGGRSIALGAYDGDNEFARAAVGYVRTSRARVRNGIQTYEDRTEYRLAAGKSITNNLSLGFSGRYVTKREPQETKFFQGDLGAIFPLFADLKGGLTYENIFERQGDDPPTLGAGVQYPIGYGIHVFADGARILKGARKDKNSWAIGGELSLISDFIFRGGLYQEGSMGKKGWSLGLSWSGPRTSLDYAMRTTREAHKEVDHIFGLSLAL